MPDDDILIVAALVGFAAIVLYQRQNTAPGTFDPGAPSTFDQITGSVIPQYVDDAGVQFIEQEEGLSLTPYSDAGHSDIGYGHQIQPGDSIPYPFMQSDAENLLYEDLSNIENAIAEYVTVPVDQNQYDAIADFIYNVGIGAFASSTFLQLLNAGDYAGASAQYQRWVYSGGKVNSVLEARRNAEAGLFNS